MSPLTAWTACSHRRLLDSHIGKPHFFSPPGGLHSSRVLGIKRWEPSTYRMVQRVWGGLRRAFPQPVFLQHPSCKWEQEMSFKCFPKGFPKCLCQSELQMKPDSETQGLISFLLLLCIFFVVIMGVGWSIWNRKSYLTLPNSPFWAQKEVFLWVMSKQLLCLLYKPHRCSLCFSWSAGLSAEIIKSLHYPQKMPVSDASLPDSWDFRQRDIPFKPAFLLHIFSLWSQRVGWPLNRQGWEYSSGRSVPCS